MDIIYSNYKNMKAFRLENEYIKMHVLPDLGGKIASIYYKPQNFEVLFQPVAGRYMIPRYGDDFSLFDTSGADEMFPNIDSCCYVFDKGKNVMLPDHGELWSIPWDMKAEDGRLIGAVKGIGLDYSFERSIILENSQIRMSYRITNTGNYDLYGLWAFHGLVSCDESTRIVIATDNVVNVHKSDMLGDIETCHSFPITREISGKQYNLGKISPISSNKTEKYYAAGTLKNGEAALTLNNSRLLYKLSFPTDKVPYLGVWINEGGFKGEYNCALEPSTGFYDSPVTAKRHNALEPIPSGKALEFYMNIILQEM
ncbi:MAG: DUF5107 domain-containing protein [Bacillota bacterium]